MHLRVVIIPVQVGSNSKCFLMCFRKAATIAINVQNISLVIPANLKTGNLCLSRRLTFQNVRRDCSQLEKKRRDPTMKGSIWQQQHESRAGLKAGLQLRRAGFGDHHLLKDEAGICFRHGLALPSMRLRNHNSWMRVRTLVRDCHDDRPHPSFKHFFDLSSLRQAARSASSIAYAYMSIVKVVVGFSACDGVDIYVHNRASYSQRNRNDRVISYLC